MVDNVDKRKDENEDEDGGEGGAGALKIELAGFLVSADASHGEFKQAAEDIASALDVLNQKANNQNKENFRAVVLQASLLTAKHLHVADKQVIDAMTEILKHAQGLIDVGVKNLCEVNEAIKQEKKKLHDRIKTIQQEESVQHSPTFRRK